MFYLTQYIQNIISTCNHPKDLMKCYIRLLVLNLGTPACMLQLAALLHSDYRHFMCSVNSAPGCRSAVL